MADNDLLSIMNQLKEAGKEKLKSSNVTFDQVSGRPPRGTKQTKGNEAILDEPLKEVPPFILECFKKVISNLMERQDNGMQELREEFDAKLAENEAKFDAKLAEKDVVIKNLEKKVRENYFHLDANAQYNRSENIKIHGIEYKQGEDKQNCERYSQILWCAYD